MQNKILQQFLKELQKMESELGLPDIINISYYADNETLQFLRPEDGFTDATEHSTIMDICIDEAIKLYPETEFRKIMIEKTRYELWLKSNRLTDDESIRAMYINTLH